MKKRYIIAFIITIIVLALSYKFWLIFKIPTSAKFDFYPFAIILILSYLGGLKLTDYLADFKDIKHQSRIEIVFLTIFFILLFVPMSHINKKDRSDYENRMLATYSPITRPDGGINYQYGTDFNNWFNDRISCRRLLIDTYYIVRMYIDTHLYVNGLLLIKNNNWILNKDIPNSPINLDMNSSYGKYFENLQKFCDKNNIKLYIIVAPNRDQLYSDKYDYKELKPEDFVPEPVNSNLNIIYPYKELLEASKTDYVYFKTDHHWTDFGAYTVGNLLLKRIQSDFPEIKIIDKNDYNINYSNKVKSEHTRNYDEGVEISVFCKFLKKFANKILDTKYPYYTNKKESQLIVKKYWDTKRFGRDYYYPEGANVKVVQIGTSMNENLNDFLPYQFKELKFIRTNSPIGMVEEEQFKILKYYKDDIISFQPDIMIFCIALENLNNISTLED